MSALAVWSSVVDNYGRNSVADSHKLSRRTAVVNDPAFKQSAINSHDGADLEVRQPQHTCLISTNGGFLPVQPGSYRPR